MKLPPSQYFGRGSDLQFVVGALLAVSVLIAFVACVHAF